MHVSSCDLQEGFIALGYPYDNDQKVTLMHQTEKIAKQAYATRTLGAVALDLAYVAAGKIDGALFAGLSWWDVAAGMLLIEKAGGTITDFKGKSIGPNYSSCMAGGKQIYQELKKLHMVQD